MAAQVRKRTKLEREEVNPESEYPMEEQDICEDDSSNSSDSSSDDFDYESGSGDNDNEVSADERNSAMMLQ